MAVKYTNWPKCPKCKSQSVIIKELWHEHVIEWGPQDDHDDGVLNPGSPHHVEGVCESCDHRWRFRGLSQIKEEWWSQPTAQNLAN